MIGKKFKRVLAAIVALAMVFGLVIVSDTTTAAAAGKFTDVPEKEWYYADVYKAVEMGLINGKNETTFAPDANLKYSEAVKLAACMHELYTTGSVTLKNGTPWYQTYVDYCKKNKIISKDYAWDTLATRAGYMEIFANSLPDKALTAINTIPDNSIPDVNMEFGAAKAIYKLYRAGIVNGMDAEHNCKPLTNIRRREVATVLARMMDPTVRKTFSMNDGGSTTPGVPGTPGTPLKITKQPQDVTVDASAHTEYFDFTIDGGVEPYKVTVYANGKNVGNGPIQKEDTIILNVTSLFDESGKIKFYVVIEDAAGASVTSNTITITRDGTPATQLSATLPSTISATKGEPIVGVIVPTIKNGSGSYAYEWHYRINSGSWNVSGDDDDDYNLGAGLLKAGDTWEVYCIVTDTKTNQTATTNTCTITVASALSATLPSTVSATEGVGIVGVLIPNIKNGSGSYAYEWHYKVNTKGWEISSDKDNDYDLYAHKAGDTWLVYCVVTDTKTNKTATTNTCTITVAAPLELSYDGPTYLVLYKGKSQTYTVNVKGGTGPYTIKWEQNSELWAQDYWQPYANTNTITVTNTNTSTTKSYTNKFRCIVTDANGQTKSFEVTVVFSHRLN